ncbi:40S ribosomal protein S12-like [Iris pallida]|uniref:40S ribosomal protein S12 n=1 Tax=Iris pallida TaxID=29817 RepID=A0AAX6FS14_IRIPA|nr:40S ribosomal protein S12-like [Iris pallida]KAJ6819179.1 40S ribosomal protein S12-like [Iris pallida]
MDLMTALQLVLKKSLAHDGLVRGLHEGAKAIEKHVAQLCVLAKSCDQPDYVKLVRALCADHNAHLVTMPNAKTLGEWAGLCKIDSEGMARKVVGCACVVVKDYGEESEVLHIVQELSLREWHRWACPHGPPVNMTPPSQPLLLPQLRRRDSG